MARTPRPPVIAVMGHIDHGKSSLLDYIREANVVAGEAGGITQHVAAYIAEHNGRAVTFLDTPGHEAFKSLRTRGAAAADIAILVVAADEGVMPQTLDALAAIIEAKIPYVVAITKIDKNNADVNKTKSSLVEHGIYIEGMGGDIAYAPISSKTGEGVPELLDLLLLSADLLELVGDREAPATGFVPEPHQDPKRDAGATLIVKDGTVQVGGFVVAGDAYAPVRFIEDFRGSRVESAGPSSPVRISGFTKLPAAGSLFSITESKKEAEALARKQAKAATASPTLAALEEGVVELPLILKADVAGSIDAIMHELEKVKNDKVQIRIVSSGVGNVSEGDVKTAHAGGAVIIGFNTSTDPIASELALRDNLPIHLFSIIYELREKVEELARERVPTERGEKELGKALVLKPFSVSGKKQVLGARYLGGTLRLHDRVKLVRRGEELGSGNISNLQQMRADVKTIATEGDFGIEVELKTPVAYGDELVAFEVLET